MSDPMKSKEKSCPSSCIAYVDSCGVCVLLRINVCGIPLPSDCPFRPENIDEYLQEIFKEGK